MTKFDKSVYDNIELENPLPPVFSVLPVAIGRECPLLAFERQSGWV